MASELVPPAGRDLYRTSDERVRIAQYGQLHWRTIVQDDDGTWDTITGPPHSTRQLAEQSVPEVVRRYFATAEEFEATSEVVKLRDENDQLRIRIGRALIIAREAGSYRTAERMAAALEGREEGPESPPEPGMLRAVCTRCRHPRSLHGALTATCLAKGCHAGIDGGPCPRFAEPPRLNREQYAVLASLDRNGKASTADLYDQQPGYGQVLGGMSESYIRQAADALEALGLVTAEDVVQRRYFTITDAGRAALIRAGQ
jgi:hypothetical protein